MLTLNMQLSVGNLNYTIFVLITFTRRWIYVVSRQYIDVIVCLLDPARRR